MRMCGITLHGILSISESVLSEKCDIERIIFCLGNYSFSFMTEAVEILFVNC